MDVSETPSVERSSRGRGSDDHPSPPSPETRGDENAAVPSNHGGLNRFTTWASVGLTTLAILGGAYVNRLPLRSVPTPAPSGGASVEPSEAIESSSPTVAASDPGVTNRAFSPPAPAAGWEWVVPPTSIAELQATDPSTFVRLSFSDEASSSLISRSGEELTVRIPRASDHAYQLVGFRSSGERIELNPRTTDSFSLGFSLAKYPDIVRVGFQSANLTALAEASHRAVIEAESLGLPVLRQPKIGEPFEFSLPTVDGQRISHETFKGKVVVMFEWATWCGACHRLMKDLFELTRTESETIQFVAISHDAPASAQKALEEMATFPGNTTNVGLFTFSGESADSRKVTELWARARKGVNGYGIPTVTVLGADGKVLLDGASPNLGVLRDTLAQAIDEARTLPR